MFQSLIFKVPNCDTGKFFFLAWADFIVIEKKMNHWRVRFKCENEKFFIFWLNPRTFDLIRTLWEANVTRLLNLSESVNLTLGNLSNDKVENGLTNSPFFIKCFQQLMPVWPKSQVILKPSFIFKSIQNRFVR